MSKFITIDANVKTVLYVMMLNTVYGIINPALIFYTKMIKDTKSTGFQLNPHDPYITNKMIE